MIKIKRNTLDSSTGFFEFAHVKIIRPAHEDFFVLLKTISYELTFKQTKYIIYRHEGNQRQEKCHADLVCYSLRLRFDAPANKFFQNHKQQSPSV